MAVTAVDSEPITQTSPGRRFLVGANVAVTTVLAAAVVVVAQVLAFNMPLRWDMTSSGVNSLSEGTEHLLRSLDRNVRITSLYFETDREEPDQARYRRAVKDLLDLFEATNRARISTAWVNPLKHHEAYQKLKIRLAEKPVFKKELEPYQQAFQTFHDELYGKITSTLQGDVEQIQTLAASPIGGGAGMQVLGPVQQLLRRRLKEVEATRERVEALTTSATPQYAAAIGDLRTLYRDVSDVLKKIGQYAQEQAAAPGLSEEEAAFLRDAGHRYSELVSDVEAQLTKLQELTTPKIDDLLAQLAPTANAILVETDEDARVVDFSSVWPPLDETMTRAGFKNRAFKGEEKLTAAILRVTHKEQTAVVFVRYGGNPLFVGGFLPGQPPAPYADMKLQLEDANFIVREWDVKSSDTPPKIDPAPTRTIFVVLKPTPPRRGPMGQPSEDVPFSDADREKILEAMGDDARALFIAGWHPGPFGPMPAPYEYNDYLKDEWGIEVDTGVLLIETMSIAPGQYVVARRDFFNMRNLKTGDHPIVAASALARDLALPWCAPLKYDEDAPPEGVTYHTLVTMPKRDGVWGVKNIHAYQQQLQTREYLTKEPDDLEGPFKLAVAAEKDGKKIVVVSARGFATDQVAFAREMALTSQGFVIRAANPGNVILFVNALHWLNDNTDFLNIGQPIDESVLKVPSESTARAVRAVTIAVWPLLAVAGGGLVWWFRRR